MRKNNKQPFTRHSKLEKNGGFTLLEVIVVVAILSIISAISIPSINSWQQNLQLNRATRDIYSNLQKAKLEAIKTRTYCTISFDANGYVIYRDDNKNFVQDDGANTVISNVSLSDYKNVSFDSWTFSGANTDGIAFSATGLPRDSGGALVLGTISLKQDHRNKTAKIRITKAGSIKIN